MTTLNLAFFISVLGAAQPDMPDSLKHAQRSRQSMLAARIEWMRQDHKSGASNSAREWFHTSRYSGVDRLDINYGDSQGVMFPDRIGDDLSCSEIALLQKGDEQWFHAGDTCTAAVASAPRQFLPMYDIRTLGMAPVQRADLSPDRYWPTEPQSFEESIQGSIHRVTARFDHEIRFEWDLDADKDFSPIRCAMIQAGRRVKETQCEYEQSNGDWFPVRCEFYEDGEKTSTISVLDASFNAPDDARELTPADLGIFPGTTISRENTPAPTMWNGRSCVSINEYFDSVKAGTADNSRYADFLKRIKTEGQGRKPKTYDPHTLGLQNVAREPGLWEEYVRRFVTTHRLDPDRTRKAWRLHKSCQVDAIEYLKDKREKLKSAEQVLAQTQSAATQPSLEWRSAEKRRVRLLAPITHIFENRLKPGLQKLIPNNDSPVPAPGK